MIKKIKEHEHENSTGADYTSNSLKDSQISNARRLVFLSSSGGAGEIRAILES